MNEKRSYTVTIFGKQYTLISDELESYIKESAAQIDKLMKEIHEAGIKDIEKVAILAALRLAIDSKREKACIDESVSRIHARLSSI